MEQGLHISATSYDCFGPKITSISPIDGTVLTSFNACTAHTFQSSVALAKNAFEFWRTTPAPQRGELVRQLGNVFRERKEAMAKLITLEMGKIEQEALGEVQEVIDICDFAVGLSRQLHGLSIVSERSQHRLSEQWHPLGPIGVITAFNFPMAVWAWNAALAFVCGDSVVWKPSEKTPLCAIACHKAFVEAGRRVSFDVPHGLQVLMLGYSDVGEEIARNPSIVMVSATGSTRMGRSVASAVANRLGKSLLELGGNAAMIVTPNADLDLAVKAATFSAVGTCGQRCTSLRRLIVHHDVYDAFTSKLQRAYRSILVGDPRNTGVHVGPLIDERAVIDHGHAVNRTLNVPGTAIVAEVAPAQVPEGGCYVSPVVISVPQHLSFMNEETFSPLLYLQKYSTLDEAIVLNNAVPQGLSSTIITNDMREAELFCSATGSDCGLANVNIGTSGAEIGGAFGGEKETGGGRESGSDAWKNYMRRQTNTVNYSGKLPLAQGVKFDL